MSRQQRHGKPPESQDVRDNAKVAARKSAPRLGLA
jgi:hypothetical protein